METFPSDWSKFPILVYEEENNTPSHNDHRGRGCNSFEIYRIEIYSTVVQAKLSLK